MTTKAMMKMAERGMNNYLQFMGVFNGMCNGKPFEELSETEQAIVEKKVELYAKMPKGMNGVERLLRISMGIMFLTGSLFVTIWFISILLKSVGVGQ
jgi:hypothetical protein